MTPWTRFCNFQFPTPTLSPQTPTFEPYTTRRCHLVIIKTHCDKGNRQHFHIWNSHHQHAVRLYQTMCSGCLTAACTSTFAAYFNNWKGKEDVSFPYPYAMSTSDSRCSLMIWPLSRMTKLAYFTHWSFPSPRPSTICQPELSHCASLSTQDVQLSGVPLRWPDSPELNSLPDELGNSDSFDTFKRFMKTIPL